MPGRTGLLTSAVLYVVNYFNAFNAHPSTSIAHLWSLGVEEQFYLIWPTVFLLLARGGTTVLRRGLLIIIVAAIGWRFVIHYSGWVGLAYLYNAFDARFDNLAIGCLLATIVRSPKAGVFVRKLAPAAFAPLVTLLVMYGLLETMPSTARHLYGFTIYSLLIAVLLVQLLHLSSSPLWRWLDTRPLRYLGTISYPIYLYHGWGLGFGAWFTMLSPLGQFLVGCGFTVIGATLSYFIVEKPFLALKRHFSPNARGRRADVGGGLAVSQVP